MRTISRLMLAATMFVPPAFAHAGLRGTVPSNGPHFGGHPVTLAADEGSGINLEHVWARATPGGATTGAAYFTVSSTALPDHLVGASTPVAALAELHETTNDNGVMKMRPVASITLDPGKPVTLKPGSFHVMMTGLKSPLKVGDSFPLTLTFEHAQPVTVSVPVEATGGMAMPGH
jgi:periplasmic copper chaperone A